MKPLIQNADLRTMIKFTPNEQTMLAKAIKAGWMFAMHYKVAKNYEILPTGNLIFKGEKKLTDSEYFYSGRNQKTNQQFNDVSLYTLKQLLPIICKQTF